MSIAPGSTLSFQRPLGRMRGGLRDALAMALIGAFTTWVALLSWTGFATAWGGFMGPLVMIAVVVAVSGALLRWLRVPGPFVVLAQVVIVGAVVSLYICGSLVPIGEAWQRLELAFQDASATAQQYAAPVPRGVPPIDPLLIAGGAACMLLVDIMVGTLRRVPLAGLPLLTIYSIPVSLLGGGVSWIVFTLTTIGFLLMLYLQESRQIARWGRPLGREAGADPSGFGVSNGALRSSAGAIGAAATALAIVVPVFIPSFGLELFDNGFGQGGGDQIKIENPMVDLRRDLNRGENVEMIRFTTDDPDPGYLRISVLNRFSDNEWSSGDRTAPPDQRALGEMPPIAGLDPSVPTKSYSYDMQITNNFISTWLPTQAPISRIDAAGDWRYDSSTMDFMAFDEGLNAQGLSYSMTAVVPELDPLELNDSTSATELAGSQLTELPPGFPSEIRSLATRLTAEAPTRFQKAVALQNFFRDEGTYTLKRPQGSGTDTLEGFLLNESNEDEYLTGYCEQFAAAMAVMARSIGIPARVAIGFLTPTESDIAGTYSYFAYDLHAWPELYFPGAGWVRFEPTPQDRAPNTPGYTQHEFPAPSETDLPSSGATADDIENRPELNDAKEQNPQDQADDESALPVPWRVIGIGALVLVALVALALMPRLVRRRRRERRLVEGPEPVWLELRDTVVDLGLIWPAGRSPRETGSHLVHYFGRPVGTDPAARPRHGADVAPEAERALQRIVGTIEQQRYARPGSDQAAILKADAETVIGALEGGVMAGARRRAEWLPRSLFVSRRRPTRADLAGSTETTYFGVVDHVG
jgi:transglutaminase-like putative cysteine protease